MSRPAPAVTDLVSSVDDALTYPLRGTGARRLLAVGVLPFAVVWLGLVFLASSPPEG